MADVPLGMVPVAGYKTQSVSGCYTYRQSWWPWFSIWATEIIQSDRLRGRAVIAAQVGNAIVYEGRTLSSLKGPMIAYGVLAIILLIVPLLVVTPVLYKLKKKALLEFGPLVTNHDQLFDTKWIHREHPQDEVILGNPDASSLVDLGSSFTVIREMGIVPIDKPTLVTLAMAAALPVVPLVLLVTPADELLRAVLKMLG